MSDTIEVAAPTGTVPAELSIAFSPEELVTLGRVLAEPLTLLGPSPLASIAPSAREDVLAAAARSLRARNVLTGPPDAPAVARAVAGLVQIASRPALRAELIIGGGAVVHRRYLSIPYASVEHEIDTDGLHRLTPFATADLLARIMRQVGFVERPVAAVAGFSVRFAVLREVRELVTGGDLDGAREALVAAGDGESDRVDDPAPAGAGEAGDASGPIVTAVSAEAAAAFVDALAAGAPVNAVRLVHADTGSRTVGGEVAWIDGGDAGLWQVPTIDQLFAVVRVAEDDDLDDREAADLDGAVVRIEPVSAADLANFLFGLLPGQPTTTPSDPALPPPTG